MGETLTTGSTASKERVEPGSVNIVPLANLPPSSSSESIDAKKTAQDVISALNDALARKDYPGASNLFLEDNGFWRDHLATTWNLRTLQGRKNILEYLNSGTTPLTKIEIRNSPTGAPQFGPIDLWGDVKGIQCFIQFETDVGRGEGVLRLAEKDGEWKIFTLSTVLEELKGYEEPVGKRRTMGVKHGGDPARKNWRERREAEANFEGADPTVLIIGKDHYLRFRGSISLRV
jgi:hypothetical protein